MCVRLYQGTPKQCTINSVCVRLYQGTPKQSLVFTEQEGSVESMTVSGQYLVAGTSAGVVKVWDISRREPKASGSTILDDAISQCPRLASVKCNCSGSKVSMLLRKVCTSPSLLLRPCIVTLHTTHLFLCTPSTYHSVHHPPITVHHPSLCTPSIYHSVHHPSITLYTIHLSPCTPSTYHCTPSTYHSVHHPSLCTPSIYHSVHHPSITLYTIHLSLCTPSTYHSVHHPPITVHHPSITLYTIHLSLCTPSTYHPVHQIPPTCFCHFTTTTCLCTHYPITLHTEICTEGLL